jgi:hypothetical protein
MSRVDVLRRHDSVTSYHLYKELEASVVLDYL